MLSWNPLSVVLSAPGDLDATFSGDGIATADLGPGTDVALDLAVQSDGRIVAVGLASSDMGGIGLARFNIDGTLDSSFGSGGIVTVGTSDGLGAFAIAVALQSDGKIVVAGVADNQASFSADFLVARFHTNGSLDTAFGTGGMTTIDIRNDDRAHALAIQSDNKIVVAGSTGQIPDSFSGNINFALVRLNTDGNLDTSFGTAGKIDTDVGTGGDSALDVVIQSDGRIVAAGGGFAPGAATGDSALVRYNTDGSLDGSFGSGGIVFTDFFGETDFISGLTLQPDGRIVAGGTAFTTPPGSNFSRSAALARYNSNGSLDSSFGVGGKVTTDFLSSPQDAIFSDVTIQSDGRIVGAGYADTDPLIAFGGIAVLARYNSNGSLDPGFGTGGKVTTTLSAPLVINAVAVQADGKILTTGTTGFDFLVLRYGEGAAPPPVPQFDICVQNGHLIFKFNSATGAYELRDCAKGFVLTGTGTLSSLGCKIYLNDGGPFSNSGRDVSVEINICTKVGKVTAKTTSPAKNYSFTDSNITNNSCQCP